MLQSTHSVFALGRCRDVSSLTNRIYHHSKSLIALQTLDANLAIEATNFLQLNNKTPLAQSIRWRNPIGIKRAKIPHKARALVLEVTKEKYRYVFDELPIEEKCINSVQEKYKEKIEVRDFE